MSATLERMIEEFHALPQDEQQQFREMLECETRTVELCRLQRKYAGANIGSETFAAEKAEEKAREDRRL
jgi:hypothetical protein